MPIPQPTHMDMPLYRGDSYVIRFRLWDDVDSSDPVDLTGVTASAEYRDKRGGAVIVSWPCTITTNVVEMVITPESWVGAPPTGAWDLELTMASGAVRTILTGDVKITTDVTNSTDVTLFGARSMRAVS